MRHHASRRAVTTAGVAVLAAATLAIPATAHDSGSVQYDGAIDNAKTTHHHHQHGGDDGHLPGSVSDVELVSQLELKNVEPEKIADVGVHEGYAYLAAWGGATCKYNGVHVVDIRDPENPEEVAFIVAKEGSAPGEGIQAISLDTPYFTGDILVTNNETCKDPAGFGGLNIYDVTKPEAPTPLAVGIGDTLANGQGQKGANEIHSVFAWDAGDKAYAVIVDNEEGPDVDIMDITNPKKPRLVAEYDLDAMFPQIAQDGLDEIFHHDVIVEEIDGRQIMLVSYWDAGYVQLDVTNPLAPVYLADSQYAEFDPEAAESGFMVPPEGNGHQGEFTLDQEFVLATDEDFGPYALSAENVTDGTEIDASSGSDTKQLAEGDTFTGATTFVGRACPGDTAVPAGDPNVADIAVVERGVCDFTVKVANVIAAGGWDAVVIFNREGSDACNAELGMSVAGDIYTFGVVPREQGYAIFGYEDQYDDAGCVAGNGSVLSPIPVGTTGDTLTFSSYFDGWGYVHLFDGQTMESLDTYAIPEAHDPEYASGFGDLSVHEVATSEVDPDLTYIAYYSGGLRVVSTESGQIEEIGHYVADDGNNFWGVQVFQHEGQEYVAASDRDHGLFIFRYTGD
ncbi:hypothetical protein E1262_11285 [Jiangella aurantiaca]|uniref:PA domain-containing protein n=1 Tax=Jiangella aurantiaca TaxID=2530373 RepID=A0A4R5AEU3_9ACTN|nr:PA domain-containing protein [Jiangella aurantiaca]TDD69850.1 hypothetical protein E1262_11285 [Jiangella aurantiaca]